MVQVSKDPGYANITNNRLYENGLWTKKPRDRDHGEVKPGDELLIYCTSNVPNHGMSLAFIVMVRRVSSDNVTFELEKPRWFTSPLKRQEVTTLVARNELPEVFLKCGHQGFNIAKIENSAAQHILALAKPEQVDGGEQTDLEALADELFLTEPVGFLQEIEALLDEKRQVIFQGPPGTGKTYVAQKLARHIAGSEERVTLVQLHPSYAYEDFVQGFRPTLKDGRAVFELKDGPLLKAAKLARKGPGEKHFLVIDEINRGNLAKVLGELYFLLEYRDEKISLQYQGESDERFSLPPNLYIIGTMNTADRSIALVDLALRRRFYFVELHPDEEPVKGRAPPLAGGELARRNGVGGRRCRAGEREAEGRPPRSHRPELFYEARPRRDRRPPHLETQRAAVHRGAAFRGSRGSRRVRPRKAARVRRSRQRR